MTSKTTLAILGSTVILVVCAALLHVTRGKSVTEIGADLMKNLKSGDAKAIAKMVPDEELSNIGISRNQAEEIIRLIVLPKAEIMTSNVDRISVNGWYVAFEKPRGDVRYYSPPMIFIPETSPGVRSVSLSNLLASTWAQDRRDQSLGIFDGDWREAQRDGIEQVKSLGMLKGMDWVHHRANPWPDRN